MSVDDVLASIASTPWDELRGPHGRIDDLPYDLPTLVTGDEAARLRAYRLLLDDLIVGDEWSKAGVATGAILAKLASVPGHPARALSLMVLTDLLTGDHIFRMTTGLDRNQTTVKRRYARGHKRATMDDALALADVLLEGLRDEDPKMRSASGFLLAFLSDVADRASEAVARAAEAEPDPWVRASLLMSRALIHRYTAEALSASDHEAAIGSSLQRPLAWLAALYAETEPRQLDAPELTEARREELLALLRAPDPPLELFPWQRAHLERLLAWQLGERGEAASLFTAEVLAQVASEEFPRSARYGREALRLCFEEHVQSQVQLEALDPRRKQLLATLSEKDYPQVAFVTFGLPSGFADRKRWLGLGSTTIMEKPVTLTDGSTVPLSQRLVELRASHRLPAPKLTGRRPKKKQPGVWDESKKAVLAEVDRLLDGTERVEALALLAMGVHGLRNVGGLDELRAAMDDCTPEWARQFLRERLQDELVKLRESGVGMVLIWAATQHDDIIPETYDALVRLKAGNDVIRHVFERLPPERREAALVESLASWAKNTWSCHIALRHLLDLADLVTSDRIAKTAHQMAEALVTDSLLKTMSEDDAQALHDEVLAVFAR